jgi:hypothetical protein
VVERPSKDFAKRLRTRLGSHPGKKTGGKRRNAKEGPKMFHASAPAANSGTAPDIPFCIAVLQGVRLEQKRVRKQLRLNFR